MNPRPIGRKSNALPVVPPPLVHVRVKVCAVFEHCSYLTTVAVANSSFSDADYRFGQGSKGTGVRASFFTSPVVDEDMMRQGHRLGVLFPSVPRHCWLGDRKGIRPVKIFATYPQTFFSGTSAE